jgi:hypothetical protein
MESTSRFPRTKRQVATSSTCFFLIDGLNAGRIGPAASVRGTVVILVAKERWLAAVSPLRDVVMW